MEFVIARGLSLKPEGGGAKIPFHKINLVFFRIFKYQTKSEETIVPKFKILCWFPKQGLPLFHRIVLSPLKFIGMQSKVKFKKCLLTIRRLMRVRWFLRIKTPQKNKINKILKIQIPVKLCRHPPQTFIVFTRLWFYYCPLWVINPGKEKYPFH